MTSATESASANGTATSEESKSENHPIESPQPAAANMPDKFDFDLFVIGTGPGGEGAAMQAAKGGLKVGVAERYRQIGGGCTHWGTIPSKALRYAVTSTMKSLKNPVMREMGFAVSPTMEQLNRGTQAIIGRQVSMRQSFYDRNNVPIFRGQARFLDEYTISIDNGEHITARSFVISTGSRPYRPPGVDFSHPRIFDSDTILEMKDKPSSITVYGAGVIGTEYASMFRNLGIKVNLINTREKLLEFLDDEIIDALSYHLRDQGVIIRHNEAMESIEGQDDGVILNLKSGKILKTDVFLWANGRQGNTDDLGLENLPIEANSRGQVIVDEQFQTCVPNIYAVGDVIGIPSLASAAYTQGRAAGMHLLGRVDGNLRLHDIPTGIYTSPEISSVGHTERELTERCVPYEVGQAQFRSLARAQITGETTGMLKLLFHRETKEILGVHCFGANASEIVHIGQAIMNQPGRQNTIEYFIETTFNYPTMAEAYRVAALNGINRLF
ncbi:Si-specific NAD(P)(+) transhydrogenase [Rhodopirellula sp. JC740]|uniref:Soluble pyridine nucleotide transhydrogenase n=2 Tax=Rhodopirellula halodulae TaxID=2894198 RepID=A0ABS8NIT3_9BACT|nr:MULTISPECIES: Si-specific NAD(P)(+) transhydrogenase [unclassified Rhodopirellula]MCC9643467.1 Si-specific NAD(P)(+) transhydrogenase [Rhodopirellula sp. JC740]MCC9658141.1 Si-specific NAD(P)(+) transhydrogenase [Rhodopirellula sp. JC737]